MRRPVLGLAALVVAGAAILFWRSRDHAPAPASPPVTETSPSSSSPPATTTRPAPALVVPPPPAPPQVGTEPPPELAAMLDDARAHLITAATPCWTAHPRVEPPTDRPDETIGELRFSYTLITDGSEARVDGLTITGGTVADPTLRDCIQRAIGAARWPSDVDAARTPVHDRLRVGDLTHRDQPPAF